VGISEKPGSDDQADDRRSLEGNVGHGGLHQWVNYEIDESLEGGNGLLGIQLHNLTDPINPDARVGAAPSQIEANGFKIYKYTNKDNLARHIEEACELAGR
jgi:hypothetical protein